MDFRTIAINRGHDEEKLAIDLDAHEYLASDEVAIADELQKRGGARAIIATIASGKVLEAIIDGLGLNGVLMVIGAAGDVSVNTLALMGKLLSGVGTPAWRQIRKILLHLVFQRAPSQ